MTDTPAKRVYAIRLARGDGWKVAEPMDVFAAAMTAVGKGRYDSSKVSRIESGERKVSIEDAEVLAAVDPLKRGAAWVAFNQAGGFVPPATATGHRSFPDPEAAPEAAPEAPSAPSPPATAARRPPRGKASGDR
jgi:hypothetical protein